MKRMNPKEAIVLANKIDVDGFEPADVDALADALRTFALLVKEAPHYFHPGYDFDGKKLEWLKRAGLVA
jgi:hypothetical protein